MDLHSFQAYGLPGLIVAGVLFLVYRLIDRGFTFHVPARRKKSSN